MKLGIGPTLRTYTICQAAVLLGAFGVMMMYASPGRMVVVSTFITTIALILFTALAFREDKTQATAVFMSGMSAATILIFATWGVLGTVGKFRVLLESLVAVDRILMIFSGAALVGLSIFVLATGVHIMVGTLPWGWRTPLWGGTRNAPTASVTQLRDRQRRGA